ncbi:TusE/DsrC/DsvC family sulfur relay protein [Larsenimonas salina]|uniref:TusE/DsrC/DsvC family sulfur relay protein n=1 Tax=Larsenimonas salina TaxID=1295565 RepID=UPI002073363C|nr:TusE/DsrC/DsvC family sulfur relay protein [Larsenimonas salina]MCM5703507.1 TusE/DsrC/DsvC family sulfur relay protein [Larsenimonas salina]
MGTHHELSINVGEEVIALDPEGYLVERGRWTPEVANALAEREGRTLEPAHREVIEVIRSFYATYELSPAMRPLVKAVGQALGPEKGRSIYLMRLFPDSPAKVAARLAGLPKPTNCL